MYVHVHIFQGKLARTYGTLMKVMWNGIHENVAPRHFKVGEDEIVFF